MAQPSRVGAAGSPGQTVSNHAEHSTSFHSETQSQTYSLTAGARVDSALNSFGIAGGATTAARGWEMATWEKEGGHAWQKGRPGHNPGGKYGHIQKEIIILCKIPLKTKQALGI